MYLLGISCYYHDSGVALIRDGEILSAAQEERFTRIKHDPAFPLNAIRFCLEENNLSLSDIDAVAFYDKPILTFDRLLETYLSFAPRGFKSFVKAMPVWVKDKLFLKDNILKELRTLTPDFAAEKLLFSEHHMSHAASAFYASPFEDAVILTLDGVGEWSTASVAVGQGKQLDVVEEIHFPHSLGLLYSAITYYLGFKVNSGEYKVMGLAPYGTPKYTDIIEDNLIRVFDDGSFWLNQDYFDYCTGLTMTNKRFDALFGRPRRTPEEALESFHMDMAASVQKIVEDVVIKIAGRLSRDYDSKNLCMAGGVALNCVANGKLHRAGLFDSIWVQPASGDAGGSLGAALLAYHKHFDQPRSVSKPDLMAGSYLGPQFNAEQIESQLQGSGAVFHALPEQELLENTASALADDKVVGWFQGRMEFGPRALGNRSILGNPMSTDMQKTMNLKIKFRESFRPFAPAVLREDVAEWFDFEGDSPYMLFVAEVHADKLLEVTQNTDNLEGLDLLNVPRSVIPAITHVDNTARIQTVDKQVNSRFHDLISCFKQKTGCGVLVNTSFNIRGEPIVCTPADAFRCFMGTHMDVLVIENYYLVKEEQNQSLLENYRNQFELD